MEVGVNKYYGRWLFLKRNVELKLNLISYYQFYIFTKYIIFLITYISLNRKLNYF